MIKCYLAWLTNIYEVLVEIIIIIVKTILLNFFGNCINVFHNYMNPRWIQRMLYISKIFFSKYIIRNSYSWHPFWARQLCYIISNLTSLPKMLRKFFPLQEEFLGGVCVCSCMDLSPCHPLFLLTVGWGKVRGEWLGHTALLQPGQPQRPHCAPQPSVIIHHILTWQPTAQPPNPAKDGSLGYHDESTAGRPVSDLYWTEGTFKFWNRSPSSTLVNYICVRKQSQFLRVSFMNNIVIVFSTL